VEKYSKEFNLDKNIVYSVIKVESKFNSNAVSKKDAKGLMQIRDITRDWAAEELKIKDVDIFDPETNIRIGCWYLSKLYDEFGKLDLVIAAYNGGSGNVKKWLEDDKYSKDGENLHSIPFDQTSNYVDKVKKYYKEYKRIYGDSESK
jgi:soluble lytic murein transglycosylase